MKASVIIEEWKRPVFKRHLDGAGFKYTEQGSPVDGTIVLLVTMDSVEALSDVVLAAQTECKINDNSIN